MAQEQCTACRAFPHADGTPSCECEFQHIAGALPAGPESFRPSRVRPYFAPPGGPDGDSAVAPSPYARVPDSVRALMTGPKAEDVDLFFEGAPAEGPGGERGTRGTEPRLPPERGGAGDRPEDAGDGGEGGREDGLVIIRRGKEPTRGEPRVRPRGRRVPLVVTAAVAVLGLAAAVLVSGVFGGDGGRDEDAGPEPSRAAPTASGTGRTATPSASPSRTAADRTSAPAEPAANPPAEGRRAPQAPARPSADLSRFPRPSGPATRPKPPRTLRPGDDGPAVHELQERLKQVCVWYLTPADGEYDAEVAGWVSRFQRSRGIGSDPAGVYGPATRRALESETQEP